VELPVDVENGTSQGTGYYNWFPGMEPVFLPVDPAIGHELGQAPSTIGLSADGNTAITGIRWSDWGAKTSTGVGTLVTSNCTPSCAQAVRDRVQVRLTASTPSESWGQPVYSNLVMNVSSSILSVDPDWGSLTLRMHIANGRITGHWW